MEILYILRSINWGWCIMDAKVGRWSEMLDEVMVLGPGAHLILP